MKTETCQYLINDGYARTKCGRVDFADVIKHYTYCPDCGGKIEKREKDG